MYYTQYNLFCLPPAGSSATIYANWKKLIDARVNIVPLDYPGHGSKMNEPLIQNPEELAEKIANYISRYSDLPYLLFGHSLGAALIWKILHYLHNYNVIDRLVLIIISGRPTNEGIQHLEYHKPLSDEKILHRLNRYGNFPAEILMNPDALRFFMNIIRHDFDISNQLLKESIEKTNIPLTVFFGKDDPDILNEKYMYDWKKYTEHWLGCTSFNGGHFYFLNDNTKVEMLEKINSILFIERVI